MGNNHWFLPFLVSRGPEARSLLEKANSSASYLYPWVPTLCRNQAWKSIQMVKRTLGPPSLIISGVKDGPVEIWIMSSDGRLDVLSFEAWEQADPPHCHIFTSHNNPIVHHFLHWLQKMVLRPQLVVMPGGKT